MVNVEVASSRRTRVLILLRTDFFFNWKLLFFFLLFCLRSSIVVTFNFQNNRNIALPLAFLIHGLAHKSL